MLQLNVFPDCKKTLDYYMSKSIIPIFFTNLCLLINLHPPFSLHTDKDLKDFVGSNKHGKRAIH